MPARAGDGCKTRMSGRGMRYAAGVALFVAGGSCVYWLPAGRGGTPVTAAFVACTLACASAGTLFFAYEVRHRRRGKSKQCYDGTSNDETSRVETSPSSVATEPYHAARTRARPAAGGGGPGLR